MIQVPDDAVIPERPAHAPAPGDLIPSHFRMCFGCGIDHPTGLHMRIVAGEGLTVQGQFTVTENHQGAPGLAHGGVLATAFDDVLGALNWLIGFPVVTGRLETEYRRPVPVGSTLGIVAQIDGIKGRKVFTSATGYLDDGQLAVRSSALFIQVPIEHFLEDGNREQVEQAIADRANGGPAWRAGESSGMNWDVAP